ncbi:MAG: hypothetical protein Athens071424_75 [Parcubacteria group bacterium Athens0714_24]|nr:MAG: hypothetical protein Athens071424_75 [Parcubacteria group bacterium Athens0714_24]
MIFKEKKYLIFLLLATAVFSLLPVFQLYFTVGQKWQGVLPEYPDDSLYYYARMHEVIDGHPFIGNPYFLEHNQEMASSFFVADWLAAMPMVLGFSLNTTVVFNAVFWSLFFVFLLYLLINSFELPPKFSVLASFLCYLQAYWLVLRPVAMQQVFPFFVIFLLALILWFKNPFKKRNAVFLTVASALSFYIYSYLWQITVLITFFIFLFLIFQKKIKEIINLLVIQFSAFILSLPVIFYTIAQFLRPYYSDTLDRFGLVYTNMPTASAYYYSRWVFVILMLCTLLFLWIKELRNIIFKTFFVIFGVSGISLILNLISNVFLGKEMETANHIGRFVVPWLIPAFVVLLFFSLQNIRQIGQLQFFKKIILVLLAFVLVIGIFINFPPANPFFKIDKEKIISIQEYAKPLEWLEKNEPNPMVIWANDEISKYIPILTKHYVLFSNSGGFSIVASSEVKERYLVSRYFDKLTEQDIEKDIRLYGGAGNAEHQYRTHNREVKVCRILQLYRFGYSCRELTDAVSFKGKDYFADLYNKYKNEITPSIDKELKKFNVSYIVKDNNFDKNFSPEKISGSKLVYQDERFLIYEIK